jgi:hypothetical protein
MPNGAGERRRAGGWRWCVRLLLLPLLIAAGSPPQADERVEIAVAVLQHAHPELPAGAAAVDPGPLCVARLAAWSCPAPLQQTLDALRMRLSSRAFSHICPEGKGSCRLIGTEVLLQLHEPEIEGTEARVDLDVWWRNPDGRPRIRHRHTRYHLEKRGGEWIVQGSESRVRGAKRVGGAG